MRAVRSILLFLLILTSIPPLHSQQIVPPAQRDPQALAVLKQVVDASGGSVALSVRDFTGSGTITFHWAGEDVQGSVTVKGRGTHHFRMEASFPDGVRTWALSDSRAFKKEPDGTVAQVPHHSAMSFESLTFPLAHLLVALQNPLVSISYLGLETVEGSQVLHLRSQNTLDPSLDPGGIRSKLSQKDFIIDPTTFNILAIRDMTHPPSRLTEDHPHELRFSSFQIVAGVKVPFSITEFSSSQPVFTIHLDHVTFNADLQDTDFER